MVSEVVIYVFAVFVSIIEGTPDNRISEGLFDVFRQSSRLNFCPTKQTSFYIFGVLADSRG